MTGLSVVYVRLETHKWQCLSAPVPYLTNGNGVDFFLLFHENKLWLPIPTTEVFMENQGKLSLNYPLGNRLKWCRLGYQISALPTNQTGHFFVDNFLAWKTFPIWCIYHLSHRHVIFTSVVTIDIWCTCIHHLTRITM